MVKDKDDQEETKIIFVGNLALDARPQELDDLFSKHGRIVNLDLAGGAAYIEFSSAKEATNAQRALDGVEMDGSKIIIKRTDHTRCAYCDSSSHWSKDCTSERRGPPRSSRAESCSLCGGNHPTRACRAPPPAGSEKVCQHFVNTGVCAFGYKCKFYHPLLPGRDENRYQPHREDQECSFFQKTGFCSYGENCIYKHTVPGTSKQTVPKPPPPRERSNRSPPRVPPFPYPPRFSPPRGGYRDYPPPLIGGPPPMYYDRPPRDYPERGDPRDRERDYREHKERDPRDPRDREHRDSRDYRDPRDPRDPRDLRDPRDYRDGPPPYFDYPPLGGMPPYYGMGPPPYSRYGGRPSPYDRPPRDRGDRDREYRDRSPRERGDRERGGSDRDRERGDRDRMMDKERDFPPRDRLKEGERPDKERSSDKRPGSAGSSSGNGGGGGGDKERVFYR